MILIYLILLGINAYFDIRKQKIPAALVISTVIFAVIRFFVYYNIYSMLLCIPVILAGLILKKRMGMADILLLIASSLVFKPRLFVNGVLLACVIAVFYAFILKRTGKPIPFIPFLIIGVVISLVPG